MILQASDGIKGQLVDLDTGRTVRHVLWFDTDWGMIEACQLNADGSKAKDAAGNVLTFRAVGRFKFIPRDEPKIKVVMGAPQCARCKGRMTLRGSDLCVFCNALDRGIKGIGATPLKAPLLSQKCERCSATATWGVSDEVAATPDSSSDLAYRNLFGGGRGAVLFDRAATVGRRFYCAKHYVPPRILDEKGEVVEILKSTHP